MALDSGPSVIRAGGAPPYVTPSGSPGSRELLTGRSQSETRPSGQTCATRPESRPTACSGYPAFGKEPTTHTASRCRGETGRSLRVGHHERPRLPVSLYEHVEEDREDPPHGQGSVREVFHCAITTPALCSRGSPWCGCPAGRPNWSAMPPGTGTKASP